MISPLRHWDNNDRGFVVRPPLTVKYDSTTCSSEDSLTHKPPLKSTAHFNFPEELLEDKSSNKENVFGASFPANDQSSEVFKPKRKILSDSDAKLIIDKAFACFDDPYAKLPFPSTPKPQTPKGILISPRTPASCVQDRYILNETRIKLRKAAEEGQKDFERILQKTGIDPGPHSLFSLSSKKKSTKKVNFECGTPKTIEIYDSPLGESLIETPLSGVKELATDLNVSRNSLFSGLSTASSPLSSRQSDDSFIENSPDEDLPPDVKSTLLSGIVCFVDCRSENEDRTESVQAELLECGAKVEKNFTKKVTHVVFKEGRMSTYIKAKKQNIPLVGILWIEACKKIRGIADPAQHRPKRMQKYDRLLPFQMITKRRLAILNPNSRVRRNIMMLGGETPPPSPPKRKRARKAVTEVKNIKQRNADELPVSHCNKKLFDNCDINDRKQEDQILNKFQTDSSTDNSDLLKEAARVRRKSAPGKLLSKRNAKREDIKAYFKKVCQEPKKPEIPEPDDLISSPQLEVQDVINEAMIDGEVDDVQPLLSKEECPPTQLRKKKKLFDPNESISLSLQTEIENTVNEEPYPSTPKRARTKATCGVRPMKLAISRKLHANIRQNENIDTDSSPSGMWFMDKPESQSLKQEPPTITFSSILKSELPKYIEIVKKLGKFQIDEKVTKHTTHLVSNGPRRTINLIKGIARGCWLVDLKWIQDSEAIGRWLSHEDYDLSHEFPAAAECCKVRRSLKSSKVMDIFKGTGKIYVSRKLKGSPHFTDIKELLQLCSAEVVSSPSKADIIIGKKSNTSAVCVSAKWVLDCVTQNLLLPFHDFIEDKILSQEKEGTHDK